MGGFVDVIKCYEHVYSCTERQNTCSVIGDRCELHCIGVARTHLLFTSRPRQSRGLSAKPEHSKSAMQARHGKQTSSCLGLRQHRCSDRSHAFRALKSKYDKIGSITYNVDRMSYILCTLLAPSYRVTAAAVELH